MNIWHDIDPRRIKPEEFIAVIEIPAGSKKKYELDKDTGLIILDRILHTSTHYPSNYGFIPRTFADDGDPLDVLVLSSEPLDTMTLVKCYPIGVVRMIDGNKMDDKIIAIPAHDPTWNFYKELDQLPPHISNEIMHFFEVYKQLEHTETSASSVLERKEAINIIADAIALYLQKVCLGND